MKLLLVHNHYQQSGGEDGVFDAEGRLLERYGHQVMRFTAHNAHVREMGAVSLAASTVWNRDAYRSLRDLLRAERPDVMHVHNTLPLISPAAYYAAHAEGVPVVQTLHNYRLLCPGANFYRNGSVCEECLGRSVPYPAVLHRCYRDSVSASAAVAATLTIHRGLGTWAEHVDLFIALTEFGRSKYVEGGLPAERIFVKPHFLDPDPGPGDRKGGFALYVGRLSTEKGPQVLMAAWRMLAGALPLKVVGEGPLQGEVAAAAELLPGVELLGRQSREAVHALMQHASLLIVPSVCYEGFPLVIVEAFAAGLPVIATDIGSFTSTVEDGVTGLHFRSGDPSALAERVTWALSRPADVAAMGERARRRYETSYTAERNHDLLMQAYRLAGARARARLQ